MAFCPNCGAQIDDKAVICVNCGASTQPKTASNDSNDKLYAVLAYFGILVLVPILAAKDSKFARFHANQGLVLFIADIALVIFQSIVKHIPYIGWILTLFSSLALIAVGVFAIIGIVYAVKGEEKDLPIIGSIKILK
ncbi:MAG: zinc-ribbon domain-containing protein [Clostridia bacterium]|nr:zinc-ribbon domain-containing protein [Clostridia bacterium]